MCWIIHHATNVNRPRNRYKCIPPIHKAARQLNQKEEFENAPYIFFGRETHGASLTLDPSRITRFDETETKAVLDFLAKHSTPIIVSSEDQMASLQRDITWATKFSTNLKARDICTSLGQIQP